VRLGQAKQLLAIAGEPLLRRAVRIADEAGCQPIIVVLGFEADRMRSALDGFRVIISVNEGLARRYGIVDALRRGSRFAD
jgi:molybdenum cofactor cytidylyltransferase